MSPYRVPRSSIEFYHNTSKTSAISKIIDHGAQTEYLLLLLYMMPITYLSRRYALFLHMHITNRAVYTSIHLVAYRLQSSSVITESFFAHAALQVS